MLCLRAIMTGGRPTSSPRANTPPPSHPVRSPTTGSCSPKKVVNGLTTGSAALPRGVQPFHALPRGTQPYLGAAALSREISGANNLLNTTIVIYGAVGYGLMADFCSFCIGLP